MPVQRFWWPVVLLILPSVAGAQICPDTSTMTISVGGGAAFPIKAQRTRLPYGRDLTVLVRTPGHPKSVSVRQVLQHRRGRILLLALQLGLRT